VSFPEERLTLRMLPPQGEKPHRTTRAGDLGTDEAMHPVPFDGEHMAGERDRSLVGNGDSAVCKKGPVGAERYSQCCPHPTPPYPELAVSGPRRSRRAERPVTVAIPDD